MEDRRLVVAAIVVMALIVLGEVYVYGIDQDGTYDVRASMEDGAVSIDITSGISNVYDAIVIDNGSREPISECWIYYDASYGEKLDGTWHATGGRVLDQQYYVSQLILQLANRGVTAGIADASELEEIMGSDDPASTAVIAVSGALPDTVYTGDASDPVFKWLDGGGRLYWAGNVLGGYSSSADGTVKEVPAGGQTLFFGSECVNLDDTYGMDVVDNGLGDMLCINGNSTRYGLDPAAIEGSLPLGFTDGKHSSICIAPYGNGMICVFGGILSNEQRSDVAQMVASGLACESIVLVHEEGTVTRTTVSLSEKVDTDGRVSVFVSLGGYYPVHAERIDLR